MTDEQVEQVARGLYESFNDADSGAVNPTPWDAKTNPDRERWMDHARAAIAAMDQPASDVDPWEIIRRQERTIEGFENQRVPEPEERVAMLAGVSVEELRAVGGMPATVLTATPEPGECPSEFAHCGGCRKHFRAAGIEVEDGVTES